MDEYLLRHQKVFEEYKNHTLPNSPEKDAKIQYHVMADGIFWDDEGIKDLGSKLGNSFRGVLHHRTSLLTGNPEQNYVEVYNLAKKYFPKWIGFSEQRTTYCPELTDSIERTRKVSDYKIDKLEKILNSHE